MTLFRCAQRMAWSWLAALSSLGAGVVINEIQFHPPDDHDELQFIELLNAGSNPVELKGWRFTKGVQGELPATNLPPGGLVVVCRDRAAFLKHFGTNVPVLSTFSGRMKHGGERVQLERPDGSVVDSVKFGDRDPWPAGPDGYGASLERRRPDGASNDPESWGGSELPQFHTAGGTPGRPNSSVVSAARPSVREVTAGPVIPGQAIPIQAKVSSRAAAKSVTAHWWSLALNGQSQEGEVHLSAAGGSTPEGLWKGTLPAQAEGRLLRYRIEATDANGSQRIVPDPNEPRPTFSAFVITNTNAARIPEVRLLSLGVKTRPKAGRFRPTTASELEPARGVSAFVVLPTNGGPVLTFDYVTLAARQDGWKVRLLKDQPYQQITTLNVIRDGPPRWRLSEALGYELFRRAGVPAGLSGHFRVWSDQRAVGCCLYVEQPNTSFLRRIDRDTGGSLYKLLWYGSDIIGQHEKKTRIAEGHQDLLATLDGLKTRRGAEQAAWIQEQFNVDECLNYFAVSQCIQNWDGYFNNYFTYRTPGPKGRWEIYPWDLDKTWGDYDGASRNYDWYSMPLTFGMDGDKEPSTRWFASRKHPWGSIEWWRPPGVFSGPLLANPVLRPRFLRRVAELCRTEFTEERFGSALDQLEVNLGPEIEFRARAEGNDPQAARAEFERDLTSLRKQLKERRAFLLSELGKLGVVAP